MQQRTIRENVCWLGAIDWDRRLFDSLIPLPDGTSYNAYLIKGSEKTVLLDSVDPSMTEKLMTQLTSVDRIDFIIANHAEQDHSGSIPAVLARYPEAKVLATQKCKEMLVELLLIPEEKIQPVDDGEVMSLGDKSLEFIQTPWVHWPETMCTYLQEDRILFSCDFFGSHLAVSDLYVTDQPRTYEAAKRYYAEIMMPFRATVRRNIEKVGKRSIGMIAPSHGPIYDDPLFIIEAYKDWVSDTPVNSVVLPYVSMHGSTKKMVDYLVAALSERDVNVQQFDLAVTDLGKLAIALVDAATIVIGTPTVHLGPHPAVFYASHLANALRPKLKFASIIGSYGWNSKVTEQIAGLIPDLKVDLLEPVMARGYPLEKDLVRLDKLADSIVDKHATLYVEPNQDTQKNLTDDYHI